MRQSIFKLLCAAPLMCASLTGLVPNQAYAESYSITSVDDHTFTKEVLEYKGAVVVDVYADWCGPCKRMLPIFEQVANTHGSTVKFVKCNLDQAQKVADQFGVRGVPALLFIQNGVVVNKEEGILTRSALERKINKVFTS